jgi:DNA-binding NarL/FixJ family response regulator
MRAIRLTGPDAAIVDIKMPPTHSDEGIIAAHEIRESHPAVGVLVRSRYLESIYAMRLLEEHPERVATCSRSASPTSPSSPTPCAGSPRATPTRRSGSGCS